MMKTMKKIYLLAGVTMMMASCSTEEQSNGGYVAGTPVTLNASLPNSGTRVTEAASDTYGLITTWSDDDQLDVLVNTSTIVPMTKGTGNTFTATPANSTDGAGFNAGKTIYGVNNRSDDKITTAVNGSQLRATLDFTGQDGTVDNLSKYDLMYGKGDPTGNITFNHKICVLRLDINSAQLSTDGITSITGLKLNYVATSGTKLFADKEVYNFGASCDSTITDADAISLNNTSITVSDGKATVYIAVPNRQNLYGTLYIHLVGSNGTTNKPYDLTNAITLSNGRMLMSTVHPQAITGLSRSNTAVKVGYYLYSDGSWGSVEDYVLGSGSLATVTPVAVIFSTTTSTTDRGLGWTHGYAMALKDASTSVAWAETGATANPTGTYITTTAAIIADKDGYTHTQYINSSTYPAAYAATTSYESVVAAPSNTSGWYLPAIGQWFDICVNLGKMSATGYSNQTTWLNWPDQVSICAANLNTYLTPLTAGTYDVFRQDATKDCVYWCSSEFDSTNAHYANFTYGNRMDLGPNTKSVKWRVRGVLAF